MSGFTIRELPPSTDELLAELQRENFSWSEALAELIDNSFDAGASRCEITSKPNKTLIVEDDGKGTLDPVMMFQKGHSTSRGKNKLGRYGVGFKHASFYIAGRTGQTGVESVCLNRYRWSQADWGHILRVGLWQFREGESCSIEHAPINNGTRITFNESARTLPTGKNLEAIKSRLCELFTPGISRLGLQVVINGQRLLPCREPEWVESISSTVAIGKRVAHIRFGLLPESSAMKRGGLSYTFKHRVIIPQTSLGCGDYSTAGVSGFVDLNQHWTLGQHKSEISDEHADELYSLIFERIRPLLDKASKQSSSMAFTNLKSRIETMVNGNIGKAKRPGKSGCAATIQPRFTPRIVREASIVAGNGSVVSKRRRKAGKLTLHVIDDPSQPICVVDANTFAVSINQHFDFIRQAKSSGNDQAIAALICGAFVNATEGSGTIQKTIAGIPNQQKEDLFAWGLSSLLSCVGGVTEAQEVA